MESEINGFSYIGLMLSLHFFSSRISNGYDLILLATTYEEYPKHKFYEYNIPFV